MSVILFFLCLCDYSSSVQEITLYTLSVGIVDFGGHRSVSAENIRTIFPALKVCKIGDPPIPSLNKSTELPT